MAADDCNTKSCSKCAAEKLLTEFNKGRSECKACKSIYNRQIYEANADTRKAYQRDHYHRNRDGRLAYRRWYRETFADKVAISKKAYYAAHREQIRDKRNANREHHAANFRLWEARNRAAR